MTTKQYNSPGKRTNNNRTDSGCEVSVYTLDSDLGKNGRQRGKQRGKKSEDPPRDILV